MQIENELEEDEGIFYIEENGKRLAKLLYRILNNDRLIIEHTEVSRELEGQGIGKQLVDHAVEYARANKLKIIPNCAFAKSVFKKYKGYEDVL